MPRHRFLAGNGGGALKEETMPEVELPGGIKAVRAENPPEPTPEAAAAGQDPALAAQEPSPEQTAKVERP